MFQIWYDSLHRLRSYCWETVHWSIRPNFSVHPVGKIIRWIEKWITTFFDGLDELYHHAKSGEDRTMHAGCRCENVVFVTMFFVCHVPSLELRAFEGCIVRKRIALPFIGWFRRGLQRFFHKTHYIVLTFVARWRHNFREIAVKNCEKSKNRQKRLCAPLRVDSWRIWKKSTADLKKIPLQ